MEGISQWRVLFPGVSGWQVTLTRTLALLIHSQVELKQKGRKEKHWAKPTMSDIRSYCTTCMVLLHTRGHGSWKQLQDRWGGERENPNKQQTEHLHATSACLWLDEQEANEATENLNKLPHLVHAEQRRWCPQTPLNSGWMSCSISECRMNSNNPFLSIMKQNGKLIKKKTPSTG